MINCFCWAKKAGEKFHFHRSYGRSKSHHVWGFILLPFFLSKPAFFNVSGLASPHQTSLFQTTTEISYKSFNPMPNVVLFSVSYNFYWSIAMPFFSLLHFTVVVGISIRFSQKSFIQLDSIFRKYFFSCRYIDLVFGTTRRWCTVGMACVHNWTSLAVSNGTTGVEEQWVGIRILFWLPQMVSHILVAFAVLESSRECFAVHGWRFDFTAMTLEILSFTLCWTRRMKSRSESE